MKKQLRYDYSKLRGRITEKFGNQARFIEEISISQPTFIKKINNNGKFTQSEITEIIQVLGLNNDDIAEYFFYTQS